MHAMLKVATSFELLLDRTKANLTDLFLSVLSQVRLELTFHHEGVGCKRQI